jgi:hypothetical protein
MTPLLEAEIATLVRDTGEALSGLGFARAEYCAPINIDNVRQALIFFSVSLWYQGKSWPDLRY